MAVASALLLCSCAPARRGPATPFPDAGASVGAASAYVGVQPAWPPGSVRSDPEYDEPTRLGRAHSTPTKTACRTRILCAAALQQALFDQPAVTGGGGMA